MRIFLTIFEISILISYPTKIISNDLNNITHTIDLTMIRDQVVIAKFPCRQRILLGAISTGGVGTE